MQLYDSKAAPNPRRVRIFVAEKGLTDDVPTTQIDIGAGQNLEASFKARNPLGHVPVLELDDGTMLSESVAICRYLEEVHPDPPLFGTDARDRAVVEMWQRRAEQQVFDNVTGVFRNTHDFFEGRIEQVPAWGELCRKRAAAQMTWLDGVLADREFVAGDRYTIADITLLCGIDFGRITGIRIDADTQPHLARWHAAVSARPSATA